MHILILPSWYPSHSGDIRGSFFREQAIALAKTGCQVGVIHLGLSTLRRPKQALSLYGEAQYELDHGVHTYRKTHVNFFPKMPVLRDWSWKIAALDLYESYVKKYGKPDLIHVHSMLNAGLVALDIKKRYDIPYVVTEHSTAFARGLISYRQKSLVKKIAALANKRLAVSRPFADFLRNQLGDSSGEWDVLPNVTHESFFSNLEERKRDDFVFLNVSMLNKKKRVDLLLEAFGAVFRGDRKTVLHIVGDGPEKANLERLAVDMGISDQVSFLGKLSRDDVAREMSSIDAFVLSSEYETFGVVVVEALAKGKPVVATRCGGPEDIVQEGDGVLVPKNNKAALAHALRHMRNNYNKYDNNLIKNNCRERFSEKAVANRLLKVYEGVCVG
ncbi:glycosyltransferase [Halomonas organivorans]